MSLAISATNTTSLATSSGVGVTFPAPTSQGTTSPAKVSSPAVTITLSDQAQTLLAAQASASANYYAQFFPTRDGSSATALAVAVTDPGAQSSSSGKSLQQVAADARANMDAKYAAMKASGKPFDYNSSEGKDWYTLMADLDRRSLYAVSSNQGGQFSKQERDMAQSIMSQQQGLAMGEYNGPTRLAGSFVDPFGGDVAAQLEAGIKFLDRVSNDEKTSIAWAVSRASDQRGYELGIQSDGKAPKNYNSENPLVKLIRAAMATMDNNLGRGTSVGRIETVNDLKSQPWFQGFESQLDGAIQQTQAMYQNAPG